MFGVFIGAGVPSQFKKAIFKCLVLLFSTATLPCYNITNRVDMVQFPDIINTWYFPFVYYSQPLQF